MFAKTLFFKHLFILYLQQILEEVKQLLDEVLHDHMTSDLLQQVQRDVSGHAYFDDFVGDGDLDANNNTVVLNHNTVKSA